ncbi:hypothetical protein [Streptomyces sp. NPDC057554]|uniref:hypothetical protein n=1 Tax=Streptomyces sp. NPDC057554 TaxID=3350538 RepID=UPI003687B0E8
MKAEQTGAGPGGGPDLASSPARKRAAANTIATELQPNTKKAGNRSDASMTSAAATFAGWATGKGLKTAHTTWERQVRALLGRLDTEKGALGSAANILVTTDVERGTTIRRIPSSLRTY